MPRRRHSPLVREGAILSVSHMEAALSSKGNTSDHVSRVGRRSGRTFTTTCVSLRELAPRIRGPWDCVRVGSGSSGPTYTGAGKALARDVARDGMISRRLSSVVG